MPSRDLVTLVSQSFLSPRQSPRQLSVLVMSALYQPRSKR